MNTTLTFEQYRELYEYLWDPNNLATPSHMRDMAQKGYNIWALTKRGVDGALGWLFYKNRYEAYQSFEQGTLVLLIVDLESLNVSA